MILAKKSLSNPLENIWVSIPKSLEKELLYDYRHPLADEKGHVREYTYQDICE